MSWYGGHIAYKEEEHGKSGVVNAAIYSGWGHMGFHWITPFHNIAGMLTESASARLATPLFLHPDQLNGGARNLPEYESQTTFPNPWPGGWWRVRDIVEMQKISAWATVDIAARNRETVLWNAYLKAKRQTERGASGEGQPYAYIVPAVAARSAHGGEDDQQAARSGHRSAARGEGVHGRRPRLRRGLVRRLDGAAEDGRGALAARPDALSGQHLHARSRRQSDPAVRHVDRHDDGVHGRAHRCRRPCR